MKQREKAPKRWLLRCALYGMTAFYVLPDIMFGTAPRCFVRADHRLHIPRAGIERPQSVARSVTLPMSGRHSRSRISRLEAKKMGNRDSWRSFRLVPTFGLLRTSRLTLLLGVGLPY